MLNDVERYARSGSGRARRKTPSAAQECRSVPGIMLARSLAGAVLAWAWLLCLVFLGNDTGAWTEAQVCALCGMAVGLVGIQVARARGVLGGAAQKRFGALAISIACLSAIVLAAGRFLVPGFSPVIANLGAGVLGVCAAAALARSLGVSATVTRGLSARGALWFAGALLFAASLVGEFVSFSGEVGISVFLACAVPLALFAMVDGDVPAVAPSADRGGPDLGTRRPSPFSNRAGLILSLATAGLSCGFHVASGNYLCSSGFSANTAFVALLAASVVCAAGLARIADNAHAILVQALLAGLIAAFTPLLFIRQYSNDVVWLLFQNCLATLTLLVVPILLIGLARIDPPGDERGAGGRVAGRGFALFGVCLALGWLLGRGAQASGGPDGFVFALCVSGCILLLLASIVVVGMHHASGHQVAHDVETPTQGAVADDEPANAPAPAYEREREVATATRGIAGAARDFGLSEREAALLELLVDGLTAQQIADKLVLSRNTVKSHTAHIYAKAGVHTRSELMALLGRADG